jgi:mono/diheme cytochrome c family protein
MKGAPVRAPLATTVLIGALVLGGACGGKKSDPNVTPALNGSQADDAGLVTGRKVWVGNCVRCHGPSGQGGVGARLAGVVSKNIPNQQNEINIVTNGAGQMPAWGDKLTDAEILDVVRFTREVL